MLDRRALALTALVTSLAACARGKHDQQVETDALPVGTYSVAPPVCASTKAPPAYPAANFRAALLDFDALTSHTLTVTSKDTTEEFRDSDCALTITRTLYQNHSDEFAMRHDRKHTFTPDGCYLQVAWQGHIYDVGKPYGDVFVDSDDRAPEILFIMTPGEAGKYTMESKDTPELDALWVTYGCAQNDRMQWDLGPQT